MALTRRTAKQGLVATAVQMFYAWRITVLTQNNAIAWFIRITSLGSIGKYSPFPENIFLILGDQQRLLDENSGRRWLRGSRALGAALRRLPQVQGDHDRVVRELGCVRCDDRGPYARAHPCRGKNALEAIVGRFYRSLGTTWAAKSAGLRLLWFCGAEKPWAAWRTHFQ